MRRVRHQPDRGAPAGDHDAAEQLVERYGDRVYGLALLLTGAEKDAEDVAREVLRTGATAIDTFAGASSFGSWIACLAATTAS